MTEMKWPDGGVSSRDGGSILISFVLDKSGSMDVVRQATIEGFNEFLSAQRAQPGEAMMSLTLFDDRLHPVCGAVPLREIPSMEPANYRPGGCTALYDAMGHAIHAVDEYLACAEERPDQILFVIMTDGLENASHTYTRKHVFDLIEDRQARGYEFVYLGANQDAYAESAAMGVDKGRSHTWEHSEAGQRKNMALLSQRVSDYRRAKEARFAEEWFEPPTGTTDDTTTSGRSDGVGR